MSTIPISQIVQVNPGVLSAGGSAIDLNGVMLTQNALAPYGQAIQFASAEDVEAYFGSTSDEAELANIYFNGFLNATKKPGILYMARYPESAIAAFLISASLQGMTLAQLQALSGVLTVTVGGIAKTSSSINLATATSFSDAASMIEDAFTSPGFAVTFDSTKNGFIFTTTDTGADATLTYASGSLAAGLKLQQADGAILSQGADAATPGAFMDAFVQITQNWACFMTIWEADLADKEAFAAWSNTEEPRFLYVAQDSDVNALIAGNTTTFGFYLQNTQSIGSQPIFGDATHAAFTLGFAASLDFTRLNGRATEAFKQQSGLLASVTNASDASALIANGYNFYGAYANATTNWNFFNPGSVSGQWKWADTFLNQIWLNANLQLAMVNLLLSVNSVPYNADGYSLVYAACMDPINAAINFGAIRKGVTLSEAQKSQIQFALGFNAAPAITANGFYLQIVDAAPATRAERQSPPMTLYYADGGSIQKLTLASIEVQ
jgi:hypothetical protein